MSQPTSTIALLQQLVDELKGLREDLRTSAQQPGKRLSARDREQLNILLPAILSSALSRKASITVVDVIDLVKVDVDFASAFRPLGINAKQLGKLLARGAGQVFNRIRVTRVGDDRVGALWMIEQCGFPRV